jgi:tetratricopeptide (TPR) repeat protein
MRALAAVLLVIAAALPAWAQSPLVAELRVWSTRYNENVQKIDQLRTALEQAAQQNADLDTLLALSQVCFMYGDVRAKTPEEKLESYDRGRQAAKRAIELAPKSAPARFWYGTNTGRWGQTKGIMRSLFLLPTVREEIDATLALDPRNLRALALSGNVFLEVPRIAGGDRDKAEVQFRRALEIDPHFTVARVDLARVLIATGRQADARRELQRVIAERQPNNIADWTVKDLPRARELLESIKGK